MTTSPAPVRSLVVTLRRGLAGVRESQRGVVASLGLRRIGATRRLPNTLSISVRGLDAQRLLDGLRDRLAASAAAACHSGCGGGRLSSVLQAMGVAQVYGGATLRLSTGRHTTVQEVARAAQLIIDAAAQQGVAVAAAAAAAAVEVAGQHGSFPRAQP